MVEEVVEEVVEEDEKKTEEKTTRQDEASSSTTTTTTTTTTSSTFLTETNDLNTLETKTETSLPPPAPFTTTKTLLPSEADSAVTKKKTNEIDNDEFDDLLGDILGSDLDDEDYTDEDEKINGDEDLNKVDEGRLDQAKKNMNVAFLKNRIRPGDKDYEFDKQVNFETVEDVESDNSWDNMDDSDEE